MDGHRYLIGCDALHDRLGDESLCIVDCRFDLMDPSAGQMLYRQNHIPGAVYADLDKDLAAPVNGGTGRHPLPDPDVFSATMGRFGIDAGTLVVCYDQDNGALAARLWWLLRWLGHENACVLVGGISRWQAMGMPLEAGSIKRTPARFEGSPQADRVVETAEIVASGASGLLLVDARDRDRFAGRSEPIDPVAGHIPGSINVPFPASLKDDGTWKEEDELRELWQEALGNACGSPWSVMCGSGVTACHLVISGLLAGLPEPRVYVGSWSEWIADPGRPVGSGGDDEV